MSDFIDPALLDCRMFPESTQTSDEPYSTGAHHAIASDEAEAAELPSRPAFSGPIPLVSPAMSTHASPMPGNTVPTHVNQLSVTAHTASVYFHQPQMLPRSPLSPWAAPAVPGNQAAMPADAPWWPANPLPTWPHPAPVVPHPASMTANPGSATGYVGSAFANWAPTNANPSPMRADTGALRPNKGRDERSAPWHAGVAAWAQQYMAAAAQPSTSAGGHAAPAGPPGSHGPPDPPTAPEPVIDAETRRHLAQVLPEPDAGLPVVWEIHPDCEPVFLGTSLPFADPNRPDARPHPASFQPPNPNRSTFKATGRRQSPEQFERDAIDWASQMKRLGDHAEDEGRIFRKRAKRAEAADVGR